MANKKTKLLRVTLMAAAILGGGLVTATPALLSSNPVVYAQDQSDTSTVIITYTLDSADGSPIRWLGQSVTEEVPTGIEKTYEAPTFPGYKPYLAQADGTDGGIKTRGVDSVKIPANFTSKKIYVEFHYRENTVTPPITQQPKTVTIFYQDATHAGDGIGATIATKQFTVNSGGILVIETPDFPGYTLLGKPDDIPYGNLEDGQNVYVSYVKNETNNLIETTMSVFRLYNPGLQVHLYTTDQNEVNVLKTRGWSYEGVSWATEKTAGDPVYRMYNEGLKVHLYTKDANEYTVLATRGWKQEGIAYRSYGSIPVYRLYHPSLRKHLYTVDQNEYNVLATRGWKQEGVAWHSQPRGRG